MYNLSHQRLVFLRCYDYHIKPATKKALRDSKRHAKDAYYHRNCDSHYRVVLAIDRENTSWAFTGRHNNQKAKSKSIYPYNHHDFNQRYCFADIMDFA